MNKKNILSDLPSVDEILKSDAGLEWQTKYPRQYVIKAIREIIQTQRAAVLEGMTVIDIFQTETLSRIESNIKQQSGFNLKSCINATGVVLHTNLGRSGLSREVLEHVVDVASGYSNLEYDLVEGARGERYSHIKQILMEITGAEDGIIVNNNAAAVMVCLSELAKGKEVIVSRGELVEIGGSFRIPDVMASSGAILREVGTTNKTHCRDYENALNDNTALLLKIHQSNFRIIGFTGEVTISEMVALGKKFSRPVMFDLGSGCLIDLKPYGIHIEPTVQEIVKAGVDIVTFSGDKLLGGPQAGVIVGKKALIEKIAKNPIMRAIRIDKMTLAAFEATIKLYIDEDLAKKTIPTLKMLLQEPGKIRARARKIAKAIKRGISDDLADINIIDDLSQSGGGALAGVQFETFAIAIMPLKISVNKLEERLRKGDPPVISRIKEGRLLLDARTLLDDQVSPLVTTVSAVLSYSC
jgi:L-seryl-tRNA(Ser) seleniumtransferase